MFQTQIHQFFQTFDNPTVQQLMKAVTALGYPTFLMAILLFVTFLFHFKKGAVLLFTLLLTAALTYFLKETFNLPRPYHVNTNVQNWDDYFEKTAERLEKGEATAFWATLPPQTIAFFREKNIPNGFPSGHTSIALAFWGALLLLFRQKWLTILSLTLIILIPFSRIYLGVHFLADVLGGYLIGAFVLLTFPPQRLENFIARYRSFPHWKAIIVATAALSIVGFFVLPTEAWQIPASFIGSSLALLLLAQIGLPQEGGTWQQRIGRLVLALVIFVGFSVGIKQASTALGIAESPYTAIFRYLTSTFALIFLGTFVAYRLRFFEVEKKWS